MGNGIGNFAVKSFFVALAILALRLGWIAISLYGWFIALVIVVSAVVACLAFLIKPESTAARLRQVLAAVRSIFS